MRKQLFLATILSAAILSAVSCQKDEFLKPEEANADVPLQAGAVERSQWKTDAQIDQLLVRYGEICK